MPGVGWGVDAQKAAPLRSHCRWLDAAEPPHVDWWRLLVLPAERPKGRERTGTPSDRSLGEPASDGADGP